MYFIFGKDSNECIPPNCTSIRLIDDSKLIFLCTFLQSNTTVKEINLQGLFVGDEGVKTVLEVLKVNSTVTTIDLFMNQIRQEGAEAIAKFLKTNYTIERLFFGCNQIGPEGEKAIAEALKFNCTVTLFNSAYHHQAIEDELNINQSIRNELKQVTVDEKCKTMALGLFPKVPIYILLDTQKYLIILNLERKTNSHKFYNNNSFSKLLEQNVSKKHLLGIMDKINRQFHRQLI